VIRRTKHLLTNVRPVLDRVRSGARRRGPHDACSALVDCPECGEGRISPCVVTVRARIEYDEWSYRFMCPTCARLTVASTSRQPALEAVEAGAALETWRWSIETGGPDFDAPPLGLGDLLDLRVALSEPTWLDTLSTSDNGTSTDSDT
jgi:hypothetical protein